MPERIVPVFVPTYECYRAWAERATDTELETMLSLYHRQACRVTDPHVRQACTDAARACEDEQLARRFERTEKGGC